MAQNKTVVYAVRWQWRYRSLTLIHLYCAVKLLKPGFIITFKDDFIYSKQRYYHIKGTFTSTTMFILKNQNARRAEETFYRLRLKEKWHEIPRHPSYRCKWSARYESDQSISKSTLCRRIFHVYCTNTWMYITWKDFCMSFKFTTNA